MHSRIPKIALKSGIHTYFINENDIIYLKAEGAYTTLYLKDEQTITLSKKLKSIEESLEANFFFRIHHSYTVNLLHVVCYKNNGDNYLLMSNREQLPLARAKKAAFFQLFRRL